MQPTTQTTGIFGHVTIITWTDTDGISINVFTAGHRNSTLSAVYPHAEREAAKTWYRTIRDHGTAGTHVRLIEAAVADLITPAVDDADLIAAINTTMDTTRPQVVDVSDIMATTPAGGAWNALRQNGRHDFSRTRVGTQDPTPAQLDRMRQHVDGVVTRAPGQSWLLLRGIVDRGLADPNGTTGRRILTSVRLNTRGRALADDARVLV